MLILDPVYLLACNTPAPAAGLGKWKRGKPYTINPETLNPKPRGPELATLGNAYPNSFGLLNAGVCNGFQ